MSDQQPNTAIPFSGDTSSTSRNHEHAGSWRSHSRRFAAMLELFSWVGIIIALLALPALITAQETRSLTLDEAVSLALETHRSLDASRHQAEADEARLGEARAALQPRVSGSGGYLYLGALPEISLPGPSGPEGGLVLSPAVDSVLYAGVTLQQPLYAGGRLTGNRNAAQARASAAREALAAAGADLTLRTRLGYWGLVQALEQQHVVVDDEALVRSHLADVEHLLSEGMATAADRLKVEARLSEARFRRIAADRSVRSASMGLADLAGLPLDAAIAPSTPLPALGTPLPGVADFVAGALERRPDLRSLRLNAEAARAVVGVLEGERLPQVALSARYLAFQTDNAAFPSGGNFDDFWDVGLGVTFNLWTGRASLERVRAAEAEAQRTGDTLALAVKAVELEVRRAHLSVEEARAMVEAAQTGVKLSEEDLRVTRERFLEGLVLNTEVLDAQVGLLEARLRLTVALAGHASALAELDRAVGR